ncbi:hypothetical protein, partial [Burkholderia pseudomallei]|uniref:hypothetical protein n=1 Tax=Burkholderia pseudomallei TaxID=28450 RepID=UPI001C4B9C01
SSGIVQLKQPRPFSKIEMARRNQAGQADRPESMRLRTPPRRPVTIEHFERKTTDIPHQHGVTYTTIHCVDALRTT